MSARSQGEYTERAGWRFRFPAQAGDLTDAARERLLELSLAALSGSRGAPLRRSRHATTYRISMKEEPLGFGVEGVFLKILDAPSGQAGAVKRMFRGASANHLVRITGRLRGDGIDAPRVLLTGYEHGSGRELVACAAVPGAVVAYYLNLRSNIGLSQRRAILHALGRQVARLHRLGYIHGDLTPYNILVTSVSPPRFAFVDHERTRHRRMYAVARHRLRNLVQLGRFTLARLSRTDRMRVLVAYADAMEVDRRRLVRRAVRMLGERLRRDGAPVAVGAHGSARAMVEERSVGGS